MFMTVLCVTFPLIPQFLSWLTLGKCLKSGGKEGISSLSSSGTPETPGQQQDWGGDGSHVFLYY